MRPESPKKLSKARYETRHGGRLVAERRDDFGLIEVVDHGNRRCLHFGSSIKQSCQSLTPPGRPVFHYDDKLLLAAALHPAPRDALILGLGAGSVASHLHRQMPDLSLTAVEQREAVIDIALDHFNLPADERMALFTAEADQFLDRIEQPRDLILVDLFDAHGPAPTVSTLRFFDHCRERLKRNGILAINLWRTAPEAWDNAIEHLTTAFGPKRWRLDEEDGNSIIYAFRDDPPPLNDAMLRRCRQLGIRGKALRRQLIRRNAIRG